MGTRHVNQIVGCRAHGSQHVAVSDFAARHFSSDTSPSPTLAITKSAFEIKLNSLIDAGEATERDGYAPFCRHLFVRNFCSARTGVLSITEDNRKHLRSGYRSRRSEELPVLSRWFPFHLIEADLTVATFLDVILYSREQMQKEAEAMLETAQTQSPDDLDSSSWFVVSVKAQNVDAELPMEPITMLRNTIVSEGGSGVALDRSMYLDSVKFWDVHASILEIDSD